MTCPNTVYLPVVTETPMLVEQKRANTHVPLRDGCRANVMKNCACVLATVQHAVHCVPDSRLCLDRCLPWTPHLTWMMALCYALAVHVPAFVCCRLDTISSGNCHGGLMRCSNHKQRTLPLAVS